MDFQPAEDVQEYLNNIAIEYRFSCYYEKSPTGCHLLGDFLEAVKREPERSVGLYKMNCDDHNWIPSCYKYANYRLRGKGSEQDIPEAERYYEKACNNKHADACSLLAKVSFFGGYEKGVAKKDMQKATKYFKKACDLELSEACFFLAGIHKDNGDMAQTFEATKRGCDLNNIYSCANLSHLYKNGIGTAQNAELAASAELKARALRSAVVGGLHSGIVFGDETTQ